MNKILIINIILIKNININIIIIIKINIIIIINKEIKVAEFNNTHGANNIHRV